MSVPFLEAVTTWEFWAPVLTSGGLVALLGAAISPWYRGHVEGRIRHEFDNRLEELRAALRRDEERLKADLRSQEDQLSALRSGALSQLSARRSALDSRRIQAVEKLWAAVVALAPARTAVEFTSGLNMDKLLNPDPLSTDAQTAKQVGQLLWDTAGLEKLMNGDTARAQYERPFVSPLTWALFSAYSTATLLPVSQLAILKSGLDKSALNEPETLLKPIREALPEWKDFIDKFGLHGLKHLTQALEQKLLQQLRADLEGLDDDDATVTRAARIIAAADAAAAVAKPMPDIPADVIAEKQNVSP